MISVDKNVWNLLNDAPTASTVKIFFFIATNQPDDGIKGYETTKIQLQLDLKLSKTSIFSDLKWLKDNLLIQEIKQVETVDFMANPYYVMNNSDRQARIDEWNRRCDIARDKRIAARQRKRLRELKKANQQ